MMKHIYAFLLICGVVIAGTQLQGAKAEEESAVYISEINWAGSETSSSDEWIELYNRSGETVDIGGWILAGGATSGTDLVLPEVLEIEAASTVLIANYSDSDDRSTLTIEPDYVTSSLALANSGLVLSLTDASGDEKDAVDFGSGSPDYGSTDPTASAVRGAETLEWMTSVDSVNLDLDQLGTPGIHAEDMSEFDFESLDLEEQIVHCSALLEDYEATGEETEEETGEETDEDESEETGDETDEDETTCTCADESDETDDSGDGADESGNADETDDTDGTDDDTDTEDTAVIPAIGTILLNEFVSDPTDGTEWIELVNTTSEPVLLDNWTIADAAGGTSTLEGSIPADGYFILENPRGRLNNDGDTIYLRDHQDTLHDEVTYGDETNPAPENGESLGAYADAWHVYTTPSKGSANPEPELEESTESFTLAVEETESGPTLQKEATSKEKTESSSDDASDMRDSVRGIITAAPGIFGSQIAYIDGIQLYMHSGDWPELAIGDSVQVFGEFTTAYGERRIKIASQDNITIAGKNTVTPDAVTVEEALNEDTGSYLTITAFALEASSDELTLEENGASIRVLTHANFEGSLSEFEGSEVSARGVLRERNGEKRLYPLTPDDIQRIESAENAENDIAASTFGAESGGSAGTSVPWGGIGLITASGGMGAYWLARQSSILELITT